MSDPGRTAWHSYLRTLATSADAALGCALAYEELPRAARAELIGLIEDDLAASGAPRLAVVAPLLAAERDPELSRALSRIAARGRSRRRPRVVGRRAWAGERSRSRALAVARPVYLGFVELVVATVDEGLVSVTADALVGDAFARASALVAPIELAEAPYADVVDELAEAVLASRRSGRPLPDGASRLADLFEVSGV